MLFFKMSEHYQVYSMVSLGILRIYFKVFFYFIFKVLIPKFHQLLKTFEKLSVKVILRKQIKMSLNETVYYLNSVVT